MKYYILILFVFFQFALISAQNATGKDRVILKTTQTYTGEILFQNSEYIIIKDNEGKRYQFPMSDIESVTENYLQTSINQIIPEQNNFKFTLKTGEVYYGSIITENEQMVMISLSEGNRYQFPKNEIESIEMIGEIFTQTNEYNTKFRLKPDLSFGASYSGASYEWATELKISFILGGVDLLLDNSFLGIGLGYQAIFPSDYHNGDVISFLPLFARFNYVFTENILSPYAEISAGYSIALDDDFGGGGLVSLSVGFSTKISERTNFQFGIYAGLQSFSADLTDEKDFGNYVYYGRTVGKNFGIKASICF